MCVDKNDYIFPLPMQVFFMQFIHTKNHTTVLKKVLYSNSLMRIISRQTYIMMAYEVVHQKNNTYK